MTRVTGNTIPVFQPQSELTHRRPPLKEKVTRVVLTFFRNMHAFIRSGFGLRKNYLETNWNLDRFVEPTVKKHIFEHEGKRIEVQEDDHPCYHATHRFINQSQKPYCILSLDGGGVRGIIEAVILKALEKKINKKVGEVFSCIAGTSTGGILAGGLSVPDPNDPKKPRFSAAEGVELYKSLAKDVFHCSWGHYLKTAGGLLGPKYSGTNKTNLIKERLGNVKMSQVVPDNLLITSYDLKAGTPIFFQKNSTTPDDTDDHNVADLIDGTTAAPTFFPPVEYRNHLLIDAGIIANNPAAMAAIETMKKTQRTANQIFVFSIGTGYFPHGSPTYEEAKNWNPLDWARVLVGDIIQGGADMANRQIVDLDVNFIRLQPKLPTPELAAMDNPGNIDKLESFAEKLSEQYFNSEAGKTLIAMLQ